MADEFKIDVHHPSYDEYAGSWKMLRHAVEGEDEVKEKGEQYLPMPSGMKAMTDTLKQEAAYKAYKARAEFPEIVTPTIRGSLGLIHSKPSTIELPGALEYLRENATRNGLTLQNLHQRITKQVLSVGRFGLLPGVTDSGEFYLAGYTAESAINWDAPGGTLDYLVLDETSEERDPETNKWAEKGRYLECRWIAGSGFETRAWIESGKTADGKKKFEKEGDWAPAFDRKRNGLPMLPFTFIDTMDLTPEPDDVPLYGLAKLAYRSYQLDADYRAALHWTATPQPWCSGVSKDDAPKSIGGGTLWTFDDANATAAYLEFSGPGIAATDRAITSTQERAIMFGAQLFADNRRTAESGEALRLRLGNQTSTLKMISVSSAAGLEKCLKETAIWAGANADEVHVEPNLEFIDPEMSPQDILAMVTAWQAGSLRKLDLFNAFQRSGVVDGDVDFETWDGEIADEGPALGTIGRSPDGRPIDDVERDEAA